MSDPLPSPIQTIQLVLTSSTYMSPSALWSSPYVYSMFKTSSIKIAPGMCSNVSSCFFLWVTLVTPPQLCTWVNGSGANLSPCNQQKKGPQMPHQQNPKSQRRAKQGIQAKRRQALLTNLRHQQVSPTSYVQAWWTNLTSLWRRLPGRRYWKSAALTCPSPSWERSRRTGW